MDRMGRSGRNFAVYPEKRKQKVGKNAVGGKSMRFQASEETAEVRGGKTTYVVFGSGSRPMVIIPGLSLRPIHGTAVALAWMYRIFAKEYRVYVIDRKQPVAEQVTTEELAEDTAAVMEQLGMGEADVIGISQGGMIAQYLALRHPELVRKLVLGVTLSRPNDTLREVIGNWVKGAEKGDFTPVIRDMTEKMYSEAYVRKYGWVFPLALKTAKLVEPETFARLARACLTCDTYDSLEQIRSPVLVLGGKEDRIVTGGASVEMAEKLGCPVYLYEGLGHSAYEEAKDFNSRILSFLQEKGSERTL